MSADDLDSGDCRQPFASPDSFAKRLRVGRLVVRSNHAYRRTAPRHQETFPAPAPGKGKGPGPTQFDHDRPRQPIHPARQLEQSVSLIDGVLDRVRVVRHPIAHRAKTLDVDHDPSLRSALNRYNSTASACALIARVFNASARTRGIKTRGVSISMISTRVHIALGVAVVVSFASPSVAPAFGDSAESQIVSRELRSENFWPMRVHWTT